VITEQTIATLFAGIKGVASDVLVRAFLLFQQAE
jgi:hypothetical protein